MTQVVEGNNLNQIGRTPKYYVAITVSAVLKSPIEKNLDLLYSAHKLRDIKRMLAQFQMGHKGIYMLKLLERDI